MNVRTATETDLDQISAIADEIAALHNRNEPDVFAEPDTSRDKGFWLSCILQAESTVIVATEGTAILGFIAARMARTNAAPFLTDRTICRIETIVVSSCARRQGIGTKLIRSVEAWAKDRSAVETRLEVFAFNREAVSFYETLGYSVQSRMLHRGLT
jgi:ribosomal protein S18 acetylase RimI-like enzyme